MLVCRAVVVCHVVCRVGLPCFRGLPCWSAVLLWCAVMVRRAVVVCYVCVPGVCWAGGRGEGARCAYGLRVMCPVVCRDGLLCCSAVLV